MCFLFSTTFKKLSNPMNLWGLVCILQYWYIFQASVWKFFLQWTPRKLLDSILFQKDSPLHLFLKSPLFILRHCSASFQKCPLPWCTNIWFLTGPDASSTYNKICVCLLCDNWRNSTWYWNFRIVSVVEYSRLPITRTLANSNLALTRTKIYFPWITVILPSVTRTLDNSNSR